MPKGLDIEFLRESYSRFSDQELLRIISQDAQGLTPEAIEIVKEELTKRHLDPKLSSLVDVQNKEYTKEELDEFCKVIEILPCPNCKKISHPLTAIYIYQAMSFIFFTQHSKRLSIGCPSCLKSDSNTALGISLLLGWWAIPHGPIRTIQAIKNYSNAHAAMQEIGPNDYLRGFVLSNIGLLTLYKDDKEKLKTIINNVYSNSPLTLGLESLY